MKTRASCQWRAAGLNSATTRRRGGGPKSFWGSRRAWVRGPTTKSTTRPRSRNSMALPEPLGQPETLLADNGYFSEANVMACAAANIEPLIATGRQPHHPSWHERFAAPPPEPENPTSVEAMDWRLRTPQGKQLYGLRK